MIDYLWNMRKFLIVLLILTSAMQVKSQFFNRVDTINVVENGTQLQNPWSGGINFPLSMKLM